MAERIASEIDVAAEFREIVKASWPDQVYFDQDGVERERPAQGEYRLGNPNFPVSRYRETIVDTVSNNLLTIISAKTGTGKSTNIPQFLFESGNFDRVVITQPRIVAARELKTYTSSEIADQLNDREHNLVGYRTAAEGEYSDDNVIHYVTDGLQLMHEILGNGITKDQVLVIDEFHERGANMDALFAIAIEKGLRIVIMSATLDTKRLCDYYSGILGKSVPVLEIPGVTHDVEERESDDLDNEVITAAQEGKNILVFLPGRKEIASALSRFRRKVPEGYTLLALHGDQTPGEQSRVFSSYPGGKIIFSTSVGQTSITIPDIDIVIDCGFERTQTLNENGTQTLATQPSSLASTDQRRGRVGRTKDGEYVRAQLRGYPKLPSLDEIPAYDVPSIQRMPTEDLQLKLAAYGRHISDMPFFDQPSDKELERGSERLQRLGFFRKLGKTALHGVALTEIGEKAAHLPLDVYSARMLIEARKYGNDVELQMMAAAAVRQIGGITMTTKGMENWRKVTEESDSDILAGIDFLAAAMQRTSAEVRQAHIVELRFNKAFKSFELMALRRNLDIYDLKTPTEEQREQLMKCVVAGTSELFIKSGQTRSGRATYRSTDGEKRHLYMSTVIGQGANLIAGQRFDLQQVRGKRIVTHSLINAATAVTAEMLIESAPDRVETIIDKLYIDKSGTAFSQETVIFDRKTTRQHISRSPEPSSAVHKFIVDQIFADTTVGEGLPPNIAEARAVIDDFRRLQYKTTENLGIEEALEKIVDQTI
ncbi:hypothetical protein H7Y40_00710, partial [Pedobacter sp.]|nr:hypothetical protein [Candidatus Saccharibacteria bacterium]